MSASREKKQRQGSGPDLKISQAQQEQAERKRKTITYTVIGVVAAVLVAALLIWNTGFFQARATAATVGGTNISVADMSYYYYSARSPYATYGSLLGFDTTTPDDEQIYSEENQTTWRDYFMETALDEATRFTVLYNAAVADGHSVSEVQDAVNAQIDSDKAAASANGFSYSAYLKARYGKYMSTGSYKDLIGRILLASQYANDHADQLAESYSLQDLEDYYKENADSVDTFEYSYLQFSPETVETKDADGNDLPEEEVTKLQEEALAAAKEKADEALADYKDGISVADLITKYTPATSADHTSSVGSSSISSTAHSEELLKLDENEATVVEGSNGYDLIVFHSRARDERFIANVRHILARAENGTNDDGSPAAPTEEAWAAAQERAQGILDQYTAGEQTADAFGELANEKSDDGDGTTGGLYEDVTRSSNYVTEFKDWIFEDGRKVGDTGLVRHDGGTSGYSGYHVMYLDSFGEAEWAYAVRNTLANQQTTEWIEGLEAENESAEADGAGYFGR